MDAEAEAEVDRGQRKFKLNREWKVEAEAKWRVIEKQQRDSIGGRGQQKQRVKAKVEVESGEWKQKQSGE